VNVANSAPKISADPERRVSATDVWEGTSSRSSCWGDNVCRSPFFGGGFRLDKLFIGSMADWLVGFGCIMCCVLYCFFCILCFMFHLEVPTYLPTYLPSYLPTGSHLHLSYPLFSPFLLSLLPLPSLIIFLITSFIVFDRYFCSQIYFYLLQTHLLRCTKRNHFYSIVSSSRYRYCCARRR